jgi:pantoate--beta-alanine ligase
LKVLKSIAEIRSYGRAVAGSVGFVPTMGALHPGHLSLVERSRNETDFTIVSIYVNPTQFNSANDLANYPETLTVDLQLLEVAGVSAVFMPTYELLYPDDYAYEVDEKQFSGELCGENRPGHFSGVLTVVMKLLNLVKPQKAYFGEKDFQQLSLVKGMAEAFFMETEIIGCPIVREDDGLAMSSRNLHLRSCDRSKAPLFSRLLSDSMLTDEDVQTQLGLAGFAVDYVVTKGSRRFGAVVMGDPAAQVRLIDNVEVVS